VVLIAKSMQPNADRVDEAVHTFVGPARTLSGGDWPAPPAGRELLLISLGTAFNDRPDFYRRCLQAFGALPDWHVVLQIGERTNLEDLGEVPDNVEVHRWVPQVAVLTRADAFLTHAGMGGSSEGLLTGTPMIAAPQDVDQFDNADALVAAGVAVRISSQDASVEDLRAALTEIGSEQVRTRSAELAAELRRAGGVEAAVAVVESLLPRS
jgi:MGT family glycosyltransferase